MQKSLRQKISVFLKPRGRVAFLTSLPSKAVILDVGCGNDTPARVKGLLPNSTYIGLDIGDYNQSQQSLAAIDRYIVTSPEKFAQEIESLLGHVDAVISAHNIEHCNEPERTLKAMCQALRPNGRLFMTFPCEASVGFPKRQGTLNFFDDPTHQQVPDWSAIISVLESENLVLEVCEPRYRPVLLSLMGLLLEPFSILLKRLMPMGCTWALYGFESIIWARKK